MKYLVHNFLGYTSIKLCAMEPSDCKWDSINNILLIHPPDKFYTDDIPMRVIEHYPSVEANCNYKQNQMITYVFACVSPKHHWVICFQESLGSKIYVPFKISGTDLQRSYYKGERWRCQFTP